MLPISVCIITYNEEDKIERCLQSVSWADEIIVIDSGSIDKTLEICRKYTSKIYHRNWTGYVDQKNYALSLVKNEWVLSVDADEEVSSDLKQELQKILQSESIPYNGFKIPRITYYMGQWIYHSGWYPNYQLRLFRKNYAKWGGIEPHDRILIDGNSGTLHAPLFHYSYRNLAEQIDTGNRFTAIWVKERLQKKSEPGRLLLIMLSIFHPPIKFCECFIWKRGFLDGYRGLIIAVISAFYVFMRYAKLFEVTNKK